MSSFAETKATTNADARTPTFYTHEFPYPKHLSHIFANSVRLMNEGIQRNTFNHHKKCEVPSNPRVMLVNLSSAAMNGKCGKRVGWNEAKQRYDVVLDKGLHVLLKKENLEIIVARVRLVNLKAVALNGKCGTRETWDMAKQRFLVVLDEGKRVLSIKAANLEKIAPPPCHHERCEGWKLNQCADCKADLGIERLADEERSARVAQEEDAQEVKLNLVKTRAAARTINASTDSADPIKEAHADRLQGLSMRVDVLIKFAYDHDCWDWPTWQVVRDIIVPATRETRCRYADLPSVSEYVGPATVFMSHCWGANFGDLVGAACHGARKDRFVWIDIFAVRQWPGNVADLDFRGVIDRCTSVVMSCSPVVVLKEFEVGKLQNNIDVFLATPEGQAAKKILPTFRLWCIVEIAAAIERNVAIVVKGGRATLRRSSSLSSSSLTTTRTWDETYEYDVKSVMGLMDNLSHMIDVEASECAVPADYVREMAVVNSMKGGADGVNKLVSGVVVGAIRSIGLNVLEIDAYVCGEKESLRDLTMEVGCDGEERYLAWKVLQAACAGGRTEIVRELLSKWRGKEEEEDDDEGEREEKDVGRRLRRAVHDREERTTWLRKLIDGSGVIWYASSGGHADVVGLLLDVPGVNVNVVLNGATALYLACDGGHSNVVLLLLARKEIAVNQPQNDGACPLSMACQKGHTEIVRLLLARKEIDVNQPSNMGASSLNITCSAGHTKIVQLLLAREEIDVNQPHNDGRSPLWQACQKGRIEIVQLLIAKKEIDVNQPATGGASSLYIACQQNHTEIVRLLLAKKETDVNKPTNTGASSLNIACSGGHTEIVQLLLARKEIDVNQSSNQNATPLFIASMRGQTEIVRLLLQHAKIDVHKNPDDDSALGMATQMNHQEIVQLLTAAGAQ